MQEELEEAKKQIIEEMKHTTRNLLIHDENFPSRIIKKLSLCNICDSFKERHLLSVKD